MIIRAPIFLLHWWQPGNVHRPTKCRVDKQFGGPSSFCDSCDLVVSISSFDCLFEAQPAAIYKLERQSMTSRGRLGQWIALPIRQLTPPDVQKLFSRWGFHASTFSDPEKVGGLKATTFGRALLAVRSARNDAHAFMAARFSSANSCR